MSTNKPNQENLVSADPDIEYLVSKLRSGAYKTEEKDLPNDELLFHEWLERLENHLLSALVNARKIVRVTTGPDPILILEEPDVPRKQRARGFDAA